MYLSSYIPVPNIPGKIVELGAETGILNPTEKTS